MTAHSEGGLGAVGRPVGGGVAEVGGVSPGVRRGESVPMIVVGVGAEEPRPIIRLRLVRCFPSPGRGSGFLDLK